MQLGHVGWGFQVGKDHYLFGSTDHLWDRAYPFWHPIELIRYMDVQPGKNNDFWCQFGNEDEMLRIMRSGPHVRYHSYKRIPVTNPDPVSACRFAETMNGIGWNLAQNNCVHQSNAILTRYGGNILPVSSNPIEIVPRKWFAAIAQEEMILESRVRNIFPLLMRTHPKRKVS